MQSIIDSIQDLTTVPINMELVVGFMADEEVNSLISTLTSECVGKSENPNKGDVISAKAFDICITRTLGSPIVCLMDEEGTESSKRYYLPSDNVTSFQAACLKYQHLHGVDNIIMNRNANPEIYAAFTTVFDGLVYVPDCLIPIVICTEEMLRGFNLDEYFLDSGFYNKINTHLVKSGIKTDVKPKEETSPTTLEEDTRGNIETIGPVHSRHEPEGKVAVKEMANSSDRILNAANTVNKSVYAMAVTKEQVIAMEKLHSKERTELLSRHESELEPLIKSLDAANQQVSSARDSLIAITESVTGVITTHREV